MIFEENDIVALPFYEIGIIVKTKKKIFLLF